MGKALLSAILLCLLLCCAGCGAPGWVQNPPTRKGYYHAVGRWPKTHYANQRERAANEARSELARIVNVQVDESIMVMQSKYGKRSTEGLSRVMSNITSAGLQGSEVVSYWIDAAGLLGAPDDMYALVRISREDAAAAIRRAMAKESGIDSRAASELVDSVRQGP